MKALMTEKCFHLNFLFQGRGNVQELLDIEGFFGMSLEAKRRFVGLAGFEPLPDERLTRALPLTSRMFCLFCGF
jgi:hypothetical protein